MATSRKPPAKPAKVEKAVPIQGRYPADPGLTPEAARYFQELCCTIEVHRGGVLVHDLTVATSAAFSWADELQWRRVGRVASKTRDEHGRPDVELMDKASSRAEAASRSHRSAITSLGLNNRYGVKRTKNVVAAQAVQTNNTGAPGETDWNALLGYDDD